MLAHSLNKKIILLSIIFLSLILGLLGGFTPDHEDSEYSKSKSNKTLLLHSIYKLTTKADLYLNYQLQNPELAHLDSADQEKLLQRYQLVTQRHGLALYLINGLFALIGLLAVYFTARRLTANELIAILATLFMGTSFFWISQMHYPTVDLPLTSLTALSFFWILKTHAENKFFHKLLLGILIGLTIAIKPAGIVIFLPLIIFIFAQKNNLWLSSLELFLISLIALLVFICCSLGKSTALVDGNLNSMQVMFQTGHMGVELPEGHSFIYHLCYSFWQLYGASLTLLAVVGAIKFSRFVKIKLHIYAFWSFIILSYLLVGFTRLETSRYIMPLLPFLAILSACGLVSLIELFMNNLKLEKKYFTTITIVFSLLVIAPNLNLAIMHDRQLLAPHTWVQLEQVLWDIRTSITRIYDQPVKMFLPAGIYNNEQFRETPLDCKNSAGINFKRRFFFDAKSMVIFTSSKQDRYINDWRFHCSESRLAYRNFQGLHMIRISPFLIDKAFVPFSQQSKYSPSPPDIYFRKHSGPYIEVFIMDDNLATAFMNSCRQHGVECVDLPSKHSFFLNRIEGISTQFVDKLRMKSK